MVQYDHDEDTAIIGGFIYRGSAAPVLQQTYLFGDAAKTGSGDGRIFYSDGTQILEVDLTDRDQPGFWVLGFGQDSGRELYVLGNTTGAPFDTTGAIYKLVPNARLQLVDGSNPFRFELMQAEKLTENYRSDNASFNQATGELNLPFVDIAGTGNSVSTYAAGLQLIPDLPVLTFELKQTALVK